ncbi:MAG: redox-regulated ATPase YchF [Lachnospiraceae bacterium]|nr:redox-regulated ATPase YchF [Lachnospiraceae bacterium]
MKLGIVGLPNIGKTTLFNALTKASAESVNYPFSTIKPNIGIVAVPDERIKLLAAMHKSKKATQATIEFVDIAGLAKGASAGEGLGNQFLSHIREVDAIVHVVRCFFDENVIHVDGSIDSLRDIENLDLELVFSDLEILDRRIAKTEKAAKADKALNNELNLLQRLKAHMEEGKSARSFETNDEDESKFIRSIDLLTIKPVIFAANVSEEDLADNGKNNPNVIKMQEHAHNLGSEIFLVCAEIEQEMAQLDDDERLMFLEDLGLGESSLDKLIKTSYRTLGLMSFLTTGEDETRAWTIKIGTKAPKAAGKIHSDIERGFIRAEVVNYRDLLDLGSQAAAREKGLVGVEGKEYVVKDGDVINFRFNV